LEIVVFLIENGADVNIRTKNMVTPLKIAKRERNTQIIDYLIKNGGIE